MTSKPVEGRKYSANLPSFNNLEEHRKGKQMQLKGDILYPDSSHITFEQKQVLISNFAPFLVGSSDWLRGKHFFFVSAQLATDLSDQQWSLSQKLKMFCSLSKRKKEPKFKMNTQFNSNVIWLQLEYKISTLVEKFLKNTFVSCSCRFLRYKTLEQLKQIFGM